MARGGGSIHQGVVYHQISRFVAGEWLIESEVERNAYLGLLGLAIAQTDWRCFCYAIMSSHIHLGLVAGTQRLAEWLRPMHTDFAQWINSRRERIGAVFVKGPNVIPIHPRGAAHVIHYVHFNPVRAGVVANPGDSDWTSHRAYVGLERPPTWLDVDCGLELGGFESAAAFQAWSESTRIEREDLKPFVIARRPPGRQRNVRRMGTTQADLEGVGLRGRGMKDQVAGVVAIR